MIAEAVPDEGNEQPGAEQRDDRGDPAVERVLGRVLEGERQRVGGGHQREVDEGGPAA